MNKTASAPAPTAPQFELIVTIPKGEVSEEALRNRDLVVNGYRAMIEGNDNALTALLHPDVLFVEAKSLPYGVEARGIEAALHGVAGMFDAWTHLRVDIQEITTAGDIVLAYMMLKGTGRATGEIYEGPTAELFRFRDGKVVEWRPIYWDTHRVREVCGLT